MPIIYWRQMAFLSSPRTVSVYLIASVTMLDSAFGHTTPGSEPAFRYGCMSLCARIVQQKAGTRADHDDSNRNSAGHTNILHTTHTTHPS